MVKTNGAAKGKGLCLAQVLGAVHVRVMSFGNRVTTRWAAGLCLGVVALICSASGFDLAAQDVLLNEVQPSNGSTLIDENGDSSDWFELFNAGDASVNLAGYGVSDDPDRPFKWTLRDRTIPGFGHLLVYASGKDRQPQAAPAVTPQSIEGLTMWLRADAVDTNDASQVRVVGTFTYVTRWVDQSGRGNHAAQAATTMQPIFVASGASNGLPALRFDGVNDLLNLPRVVASNDFCLVAVARTPVAHEIDPESAGGVGGVAGQRYLFGANHGGDFNGGAGVSFGTNGVSVYEHGSGYMPALAVHAGQIGAGLAVIAVNYQAKRPSLVVQGLIARQGVASPRAIVTAPTQIGSGAYGGLNGHLAEVLIYNRALTTNELLGLHQHFAEKYSLTFAYPLHANFSLRVGDEPLLLTRPDGQRADEIPARYIPRDVSYGRQPDGSNAWYFFAQPTPGCSNTTPASAEILEPPRFSHAAGFYSNSFQLTLDATTADASIRYTLDGSEPTERSLLYTNAITVTNRSNVPNVLSIIPTAGGWQAPLGNVNKGTVVRAIVFKPGALPSAIETRTYLVTTNGRARYSLPVVSLVTDRANFFDNQIGIYVCGNATGCNYAQSGDAWERPVHVEFFETNGTVAFAQESGVRMHGNTSFGFPVKALRLHPLNQRGRGPFRHQIFPDLPIREFSRLLLRPSGHDYYLTMMRDGLMQNLARELGLDMQGYRPAILFLNGEYWGIHNLQEAFEKNYFASHHGVDPDEVDYLEGYAPGIGAVDGDGAEFNALIQFMQAHSLAQSTNYDYVQTQMEVDNFIDYKIAETIYYRWDIGNHRVWQPRTPDGRFRWILFDCDVGYGGFWAVPPAHAFNMLAYNTEPNGPWTQYQNNPGGNDHNSPTVTFQLRALLTNPTFKRDFINRCADLLNTTFSTNRMVSFIDRMAAEIAPEMTEHTRRWRQPSDLTAWNANVRALREFAVNRPRFMRQHVTNKFGLRGLLTATLSVNDTNAGSLQINSLATAAPTSAPWTGTYFRDNPITLTAVAQPGYRFAGWSRLADATNRVTLLPAGDFALTANFAPETATNATFRSVAIEPPDSIRLRFVGSAFTAYRLQTSTNLTDWTPLASATTDADGTVEFVDASGRREPARFYRIVWP